MYIRRGFGSADPAGTIAATIQKVEGYYPGSLAYRDNNPGNLIFVGQPGAVQGPPMPGTKYYYASFPSYDAGYQALLSQVKTYGSQGLTIQQMMNKYAPATDANGNPTGNDPTGYANSIAASLGVSTDTTVADALAGSSSVDPSAVDYASVDLSSVSSPVLDPVSLGLAAVVAGLFLYAVS